MTAAAPRFRRILWRLGWTSLIGGVLLSAGLALVGAGVAGGGPGLVVSLIPALITIGIGMAIPPVLGAALGLAIVARPPRALRREQWASALGGAVGAFVSPVLFYPASILLALAIALLIIVAVGIGYPWALRSTWRQSTAAP